MSSVISQEHLLATEIFLTGDSLCSWHVSKQGMRFEEPKLYLAKWRKRAGLTQEGLSEVTSYARGYIAKCETGDQNVSLTFLITCARSVGAPNVQSLFTDPDIVSPDSAELSLHFHAIKSETDRNSLLQVARSLSEKGQTAFEHDSS